MNVNQASKTNANNNVINSLLRYLGDNQERLLLSEAHVYTSFPILKDLDNQVVIAEMMIVSRLYGVLLIGTSDATTPAKAIEELETLDQTLDHAFSLLYSRLVRNKALRKSKTELAFPTNAVIFAPHITRDLLGHTNLETDVVVSYAQIETLLRDTKDEDNPAPYEELLATLEGAKGLMRPRPRITAELAATSKGNLANLVESEMVSFDQQQKHGYMQVLDGLQRIRGLAGSGKTVVLAMKAALTHLREPDATILYTFYTRSLYQHIQRLITRFYRQFDDRDPDWSKVRIMHAWGGYNSEGVYFNTCKRNGVAPLTYSEAVRQDKNPFDLVCKQLLETESLASEYDFVFVDEGQDFPASFIRLCIRVTTGGRVVFAYDDLQTIFQQTTPSLKDIAGVDQQGQPLTELSDDIVLHKCYRNPREILICAHALGFGFYGTRIVQMLENKEQWEDIGYSVASEDFRQGSLTRIERPSVNSLSALSDRQKPQDIVQASIHESYQSEIEAVAKSIEGDIEDGLRPDDILVIAVDDRFARNYFMDLANMLAERGIATNNTHSDTYGIRDFQQDGYVTLSTVHKAKGNEAFMVYVAGVDALFSTYAGVRERNVLFTAMTRAKGWVRVSGVGEGARLCKHEIDEALNHLPYLEFVYPSDEQLKIIRRDLASKAIRKQKLERQLDAILDEMTPDEVRRFMEQKSIKKGK